MTKFSSRNRLYCGMCGKSDKHDKDELITCSVCGLSGHSKCLGCSEALLKRIKEFPKWECPNCKKCPLCGEHDDETNLICIVCDRGFHRSCLNINLSNSGKSNSNQMHDSLDFHTTLNNLHSIKLSMLSFLFFAAKDMRASGSLSPSLYCGSCCNACSGFTQQQQAVPQSVCPSTAHTHTPLID